MRLVFATNSSNKLKEVIKITPSTITILSLKDIDSTDELPETGTTIKSNAFQKARYIYEKFGMDCFADDTGLEVDALNGRPGVYSARFAGPQADSSENIQRLLNEMKGIRDRRAKFRTVIALIVGGKEYYFEGEISGSIAETPVGTGGFGYDSVFIPLGSNKSFAEISEEEKNSMSHRAIAVKKLNEFLSKPSF